MIIVLIVVKSLTGVNCIGESKMKIVKKPIDITYQGACPNCYTVLEMDSDEFRILLSPAYGKFYCPVCNQEMNRINTDWEKLIVYNNQINKNFFR